MQAQKISWFFFSIAVPCKYRMTAKPLVCRLDVLRDILGGPCMFQINVTNCILQQRERCKFFREADHSTQKLCNKCLFCSYIVLESTNVNSARLQTTSLKGSMNALGSICFCHVVNSQFFRELSLCLFNMQLRSVGPEGM